MVDQTQDGASPGVEHGRSGLETLVDTYLGSAEASGSGTYATSARSGLESWQEWMAEHGYGLDELGDESEGPTIMRRYAQHLRRRSSGDDGIVASTARTYYAYIRACLAWGVRDGRHAANQAVSNVATEELPTSTTNDTTRQYWTIEQRDKLLEYVRRHAHNVIDEDPNSPQAVQAARDRALVTVLYYSAVTLAAEVLRNHHDDREGRQGLRWRNVDVESRTIRIFGKGEQEWVPHPLPGPSAESLAKLRGVQRPASEDWPVFATSHAPSLWDVARDHLPGRDVEALVDDHGSIQAVLREHDIVPPALTTNGARNRLW